MSHRLNGLRRTPSTIALMRMRIVQSITTLLGLGRNSLLRLQVWRKITKSYHRGPAFILTFAAVTEAGNGIKRAQLMG